MFKIKFIITTGPWSSFNYCGRNFLLEVEALQQEKVKTHHPSCFVMTQVCAAAESFQHLSNLSSQFPLRYYLSYQLPKSLYCPALLMIITGKMSSPQMISRTRMHAHTHAYTCKIHLHTLAPCDLPLVCKAFINT